MATVSKVLLSSSTQGKAVKVAATATAGTPVHTTGASAAALDEIWVYAQNNHTADVQLTVEFGGPAAPDNNIIVTIPAKSGLLPVIPGLLLSGDGSAGATVKAFAAVANVVTLTGFANRIS